MDDHPALKAQDIEHPANVLKRCVWRLIISTWFRRILLRVAVDMKLTIAALCRRKWNRRARLTVPLRKDFLFGHYRYSFVVNIGRERYERDAKRGDVGWRPFACQR